MSLDKRSVISEECAHSCRWLEHTGEHGSKSKLAIKKYYEFRVGSQRGASIPIHRPQARRDRPRWRLPPSLHDQHRALRELHDAVGAAADHALVQCRMAFRADDEQIDFEL